MPNFIDIELIASSELQSIIDQAILRKKNRFDAFSGEKDKDNPLQGLILAMLFEIPSTRTRVSFDIGIRQLGGSSLIMNSEEMQLGRGESIADTSRVLSNYVDIIMLRSLKHRSLEEMTEYSSVPVINGLTDQSHPCQVLADLMTFIEIRGSLENKKFVWIGDFNNVTRSWIHAAQKFNFKFIISSPKELIPDSSQIDTLSKSLENISYIENSEQAVLDADCVITDVWMSMSDSASSKEEVSKKEKKLHSLKPYKVTSALLNNTNDALFMHCLPAHRGQEVDTDVIDGNNSVVWQEAENRLHVQKAIMLWCLKDKINI